MSFFLRQITKRDHAPDIVRERKLSATAPVIGRGSDCDIQLTDLAVSLRHARISQTAPGRVLAEALGDENFEVNGKFVHRAEVALADVPVLGFGSHRLALLGAGKDDVLVVATSHKESAAAATEGPDRAFSLRHGPLNQRRLAWAFSLSILLLCLIVPVAIFLVGHNQNRMIAATADRQWSSGPLSPGHHFLEKNCEACHQQAFVSVKDSACLACHQAGLDRQATAHRIAVSLRLGSPFPPDPAADHAPHDRLMMASPPDPNLARRLNSWIAETFSHPNNRCASCHTEHMGNGHGETGKAPLPITPTELKRNDCKDCHAGMSARLPDAKVRNVPDWAHHPDFRPLITVGFRHDQPLLERVALSSPRQKDGLIFAHDVHLDPKGAVARQALELGNSAGYGAPLTCDNCHRPKGDGNFVPIEMKRDCGTCHSLAFSRRNGVEQTLPHGHPDQVVAMLKSYLGTASFQAGAAEGFLTRPGMEAAATSRSDAPNLMHAVFGSGGLCAICHTVTPPSAPGRMDYGVAPVHLTHRYLPWGGFNHNIPEHTHDSHGAPNCQSCHKVEHSDKAEDVMLPGIGTCAACHGKSRQEVAARAGSDCTECHGFHNPGQPAWGRQKILAQNALVRTR